MDKEKSFKYIYGPVSSWRLGSSLGIDLLSQEAKICSFDCIYCQLGKTLAYTSERKLYIPTEEVIKELEMLPEDLKIDYITFSGRGEPTLAENLGQMIKAIKTLKKEPIAVLTNSFLIHREDVRRELTLADFVVAKLDAYSQESLQSINRPAPGIKFIDILNGIKAFRRKCPGKLALQMMFVEKNKGKAKELLQIAKEINPDEIQINTPLRPCEIKPLSKQGILKIKKYFEGLNIISVYDAKLKETVPIGPEETLRRRGKA